MPFILIVEIFSNFISAKSVYAFTLNQNKIFLYSNKIKKFYLDLDDNNLYVMKPLSKQKLFSFLNSNYNNLQEEEKINFFKKLIFYYECSDANNSNTIIFIKKFIHFFSYKIKENKKFSFTNNGEELLFSLSDFSGWRQLKNDFLFNSLFFSLQKN